MDNSAAPKIEKEETGQSADDIDVKPGGGHGTGEAANIKLVSSKGVEARQTGPGEITIKLPGTAANIDEETLAAAAANLDQEPQQEETATSAPTPPATPEGAAPKKEVMPKEAAKTEKPKEEEAKQAEKAEKEELETSPEAGGEGEEPVGGEKTETPEGAAPPPGELPADAAPGEKKPEKETEPEEAKKKEAEQKAADEKKPDEPTGEKPAGEEKPAEPETPPEPPKVPEEEADGEEGAAEPETPAEATPPEVPAEEQEDINLRQPAGSETEQPGAGGGTVPEPETNKEPSKTQNEQEAGTDLKVSQLANRQGGAEAAKDMVLDMGAKAAGQAAGAAAMTVPVLGEVVKAIGLATAFLSRTLGESCATAFTLWLIIVLGGGALLGLILPVIGQFIGWPIFSLIGIAIVPILWATPFWEEIKQYAKPAVSFLKGAGGDIKPEVGGATGGAGGGIAGGAAPK